MKKNAICYGPRVLIKGDFRRGLWGGCAKKVAWSERAPRGMCRAVPCWREPEPETRRGNWISVSRRRLPESRFWESPWLENVFFFHAANRTHVAKPISHIHCQYLLTHLENLLEDLQRLAKISFPPFSASDFANY